MRDDIIEACALAAVNANRALDGLEPFASLHMTGDAELWLRDARAVLTAFKEATAEPTPGMVEATGAKGRVRITIIFGYRAMHEQLWQEIGI